MIDSSNPAAGSDANGAGDVKRAILAYAQSEKIKSGLIWICHIADQAAAADPPARHDRAVLLANLARMVADEVLLAGRITGDRRWVDVHQKMNMALVMIESGVPQETGFHLTQALSQVTRMGGQAAAVLERQGLW